MRIKVIQVGFGSLGKQIFKEIYQNKDFQLLQVIDTDPGKANMDPGKIINSKTRYRVKNGIKDGQKPDIIIHATVSSISDSYEQFKNLVKCKVPIISTCEELVYPIGKNKKIAKKIDELARKNNIPILGIGVNPGYIMDSLVLVLSNLTLHVKGIEVFRKVNLAKRRKALQDKMLVGSTANQFQRQKTKIGHIGLEESAIMICDHFKIKPIIKKTIRPVISPKRMKTSFFNVRKGEIIGIQEKLTVKHKQKPFLKMTLDMHLGAKDTDSIIIYGSQPIRFQTSGVNGDKSTIALLLNYIPTIIQETPGLFTVSSSKVEKFTS